MTPAVKFQESRHRSWGLVQKWQGVDQFLKGFTNQPEMFASLDGCSRRRFGTDPEPGHRRKKKLVCQRRKTLVLEMDHEILKIETVYFPKEKTFPEPE